MLEYSLVISDNDNGSPFLLEVFLKEIKYSDVEHYHTLKILHSLLLDLFFWEGGGVKKVIIEIIIFIS